MNTKTRKTGARLGAILLSLCLIVGLLPVTALAGGRGWDGPTKAFVKAVFSDAVETAGADSQICAATVTDESGDFVLHYVYSPNAIRSKELMDQIRDGLEEPYKSLIPVLEKDDNDKKGFLFLSDDQYEDMELNWADPAAVAEALVPGSGTVTTVENTSSVFSDASADIINDYCKDYDEKVIEFINEIGESITPPTGTNIIEAIDSVSKGGPFYIIEDGIMKECNDVVIVMHVAQIYAYTATKAASASDPIDLPVRVLEEGDAEYSPAPELSATFTPDTAVTVGEFNQWQGLAIDYYNPMVETEWYEPVSEGYDVQAGYTVSIPLTDYEGETLSGTLTIPLPEGSDGASARIKGGAAAGSYTATTVSFPVTLEVSGGSADLFGLLIEYKEAQEPVQPPVIIAGANGSWQKSGTDGLSFTSNAAFADFTKVQVDGKDLDASNYTVKEGSTIVTLNAAYLNTLSVGKHTLSVVSANGTATTEFTITAVQTGGDDQTGGSDQTGSDTTPQEPDKNGGDTTSPQTGDSSNMMLWIALLILSGGASLAVLYRKKLKSQR